MHRSIGIDVVRTAEVRDQRDKHPTTSHWYPESGVIHVGSRQLEVLPARQAELVLVVGHPPLALPIVDVILWGMDVHASVLQLAKETRLQRILPELAIRETAVVRMARGGRRREQPCEVSAACRVGAPAATTALDRKGRVGTAAFAARGL